jgi:regulation of enolase protein 1 (concanavalin A-like superfamily)
MSHEAAGTIDIPGLPPLRWTGDHGDAHFDPGASALTLVSARGVDWTNDAFGGEQQQAATALAFDAPETFTLSARISVTGQRSTFDAGALAIWADSDHWAKLCFEFSPQAESMVVSVVTADGFSDDTNSSVVGADAVFLRLTRIGSGWAFHESRDGATWSFVRQFRLALPQPPLVGFLAQAPMGDACTAVFDHIAFDLVVPRDLRDGS